MAKYDVDRFIHVSAHNADPTSSSEFFATKVILATLKVNMSNTGYRAVANK